MKKIAFVVLHYRGIDATKECIKSLCEMGPVKNFSVDVIIVDNNSPEPFPEKEIHCAIGTIRVIRTKENLGYSGGMNAGISLGLEHSADYIAVVNNDTVFDKDFLQATTKRFLKEKDLGIIVPKIYFYPGTEYHHDRYEEKERGKVIWYAGGKIDWANILASHKGVDEVDFGQHDNELETSFATGCCIIIPKEVLKKVGYFDDNYYLYFEDIDLSMRIKKEGFRIYFEPRAILWHKNAKSAGGSGSALQDYFISRNRMLFAMRYAPLRAKLAVLMESIRILKNGRQWQRRGIVDFYLSRFNKGTFLINGKN